MTRRNSTSSGHPIPQDAEEWTTEWRKEGGAIVPVAVPIAEYNAKRDTMAKRKLNGDTSANNNVIEKPKRAKRSKADTAERKARAHEMFRNGSSVSDVAKELDISYGNAHYFHRTFKS